MATPAPLTRRRRLGTGAARDTVKSREAEGEGTLPLESDLAGMPEERHARRYDVNHDEVARSNVDLIPLDADLRDDDLSFFSLTDKWFARSNTRHTVIASHDPPLLVR